MREKKRKSKSINCRGWCIFTCGKWHVISLISRGFFYSEAVMSCRVFSTHLTMISLLVLEANQSEHGRHCDTNVILQPRIFRLYFRTKNLYSFDHFLLYEFLCANLQILHILAHSMHVALFFFSSFLRRVRLHCVDKHTSGNNNETRSSIEIKWTLLNIMKRNVIAETEILFH